MADKIQCPICGRLVDVNEEDFLDNGSPACHECAENERNREENIQN